MSTTVELHRVKAELAALRSRVEALAGEWQVEAADLRRDYLSAGLPSFLASAATIEVCADELRSLLGDPA